ncbi:uncharacterized protein LOC131693048 [Topomyia yanbarensis]|uniref:uncharacterized protein LOC131693048 n=1 Tax=Topomyia yanbarensis TaxID=2498891 RepID=UPI00273B8310|nr:uncharacterized protein LOC131693048 [Topomyia yanbarensis]
MDFYRVNANDLQPEEIDYELSIRSRLCDENWESKRRTLRKLLREGEPSNFTVVSHYTLVQDLIRVPLKLKEIEKDLIQDPSSGCLSRLVHYHKRIRRYVPQNTDQKDSQVVLLDAIDRLASQYFKISFPDAAACTPTINLVPDLRNERSFAMTQYCSNLGQTLNPETKNVIKHSASHVLAPFQMTGEMLSSTLNRPTPGILGENEGAVGGILAPSDIFPPQPHQLASRTTHTSQGPWVMNFGNDPTYDRQKSAPDPTTGTIHASWPLTKPDTVAALIGNESTPLRHNTNPARTMVSFPGAFTQNRLDRNGGIQPPAQGDIPPINPLPKFIGEDRATKPEVPSEEKANRSEYIHMSEIESYIKTYVDRVLGPGPKYPEMTEAAVSRLADQIANVGLKDQDLSRISQGRPMFNSTQLLAPEPPLQLSISGQQPPRSEHNQGAYNIQLDRSRASPMPRFIPNPGSQDQGGLHPHVRNVQTPMGNPDPSFFARRLPHQQCNIIEKWPKFSGDTNLIPVTDFLRQVDILCRSYAISKQELRMHAHLLFKDSAYVWYTTYEEKFYTWETLETYLRMRYHNPNRDRIIRVELRNRKQRPNELFSAFLTDIETLAQRMIQKMSEREKFDLIVENMKMSYKRHLALEPIYSVEHLAQLCFKFDALETNLYVAGNPQKPSVHQVTAEDGEPEEEDNEETERVYALQNRFRKPPRTSENRYADRQSHNTYSGSNNTLCWNCRQTGHMWRECDQKKTVFCHICGHLDTTAFRCPNKHNLSNPNDEESKNE